MQLLPNSSVREKPGWLLRKLRLLAEFSFGGRLLVSGPGFLAGYWQGSLAASWGRYLVLAVVPTPILKSRNSGWNISHALNLPSTSATSRRKLSALKGKPDWVWPTWIIFSSWSQLSLDVNYIDKISSRQHLEASVWVIRVQGLWGGMDTIKFGLK